MRDRDALLELIAAAFPCEPIDAAAAFEGGRTTYLNGEAYGEQLEGKTWAELDREYIVRRHDALGFLDVPGLVAVLPVYLQSLVEEGAWSPAATIVLMILTKPQRGYKPGLGVPRFRAFVEALTPAQRTAIAAVLQGFAERYGDDSPGLEARMALDEYWAEHLPPVA